MVGLVAQVVLLAVLDATAGLRAGGWIVGLVAAGIIAAALARGIAHGGRFGPASWVTLARATIAVGVAALIVGDPPVALIVTLASIGLALDAVDGRLARRTGTTSALGARFDGEVDALLILALSLYVAPDHGAWVLLIGAARYVFLAGEVLVPWMAPPLPPSPGRKVVAAVQGIVLTVAAAGVVPTRIMQTLLLAALAALVASMGHSVWWLWRRRHAARSQVRERPALGAALTAAALLIVWAALVVPNRTTELTPGAFARLPIELLVLLALTVVLPTVPRRVAAVVAGVVLGALVVVKFLDMGFAVAFNRPFDPTSDWNYAGIGVETLGDAIGSSDATLAAIVIVVLAAALLTLPALALLRLTRVAAGHRDRVLAAATLLAVVWVGLRIAGAPSATMNTAALAVDEVQAVRTGLRARDVLAREIARDRFVSMPRERLLSGLRGRDVFLVFVESYGRVAVEKSSIAPGITTLLERESAALRDSGFSARSAFLSSSTFGGLSWLAHATLQSGVRIGTQRGYAQLLHSDRFTLSQAFAGAGWRTVGVMPAHKRDWREGVTFYGFDAIYDRRNLGYRGPPFGLPSMPDQYALEALRRFELARGERRPVFAEVDLLSSHAPWTRIPPLIAWDDLGDGSIFHRLPVWESSEDALLSDPGGAREAYGRSIAYALRTVFSFVRHHGGEDAVFVVLGDHQPATVITGQGAGHDVPISVITRDRAVIDRVAGWRWQDGVRPTPAAPVWPMEAFRDRFLGAFAGPRT